VGLAGLAIGLFGEPTGWVRPDDGLLARDSDGDGLISSIDELFGGVTGDGFLDLAASVHAGKQAPLFQA